MRKTTWDGLRLGIATALATVLAIPALAAPRFAAWKLAGRDLRTCGHALVTDRSQGVHLYSSIECDGGHRRLILSRDLDAIRKNEGYEASKDFLDYLPQSDKPLAAATELGVKLGDTPEAVRARLGAPARDFFSKKFQARELIYKYRDARQQRLYASYYLFREGRLFYIELSWDIEDGD
jgi:hypothetical protein